MLDWIRLAAVTGGEQIIEASKGISKGDLLVVLVETMVSLQLIRVTSTGEAETDEVASIPEGGRGAIKQNLGSVSELDAAHFLLLFCLPLKPALHLMERQRKGLLQRNILW